MKKLTFLIIFSFLFANINEAIEEFKQKNYKKSFEMFSKIKSPKAYYYLAKHYYYGYGVKKDINKALKYAQIACNENEHNGCNGQNFTFLLKLVMIANIYIMQYDKYMASRNNEL